MFEPVTFIFTVWFPETGALEVAVVFAVELDGERRVE